MNWSSLTTFLGAAAIGNAAFAAILPTDSLALRYEARQHAYQSIAVHSSDSPLLHVGDASDVGDPIATLLNLADPDLTPPLQTTVASLRSDYTTVDGVPVARMEADDNLVAINRSTLWGANILGLSDDDFTYTVAFRTDTADQTNGVVMGVGLDSGGITGSGMLQVALLDGNMEVRIDPASQGNYGANVLSTAEIIGDWVVVTAVRNGGDFEVFVNGASIGALNGLAGSSDFGRLRVGHAGLTGSSFTGDLAGVYAWGNALSESQLADVHGYMMNDLIPEPASMVLMGVGGLMLLRRQRVR